MEGKAVVGWHIANWGLWGWIETGLKLVGIAAAIAAFVSAGNSSSLTIGGNPHLAAVIWVGLLSLAMLSVILMRIKQKELISIIFSILNAAGHVALLVALLRVLPDQTLPIIFAVTFILGELAKQRFLTISGYVESGANTASMLKFSRVVAVVYLVLAVLLIL